MYDFEAGEWVTPVSVVVFDEDGETCKNVVVKPRLEDGDVQPHEIEIEDELGNKKQIGPGMKRGEVRVPRYRRVPVRLFRRVLQSRGLLDDFMAHIDAAGFDADDLAAIQSISLNNRILREFVQAQGFTMRQAYNALQRDAEEKQKQERAKRRELARESGRGNGNA